MDINIDFLDIVDNKESPIIIVVKYYDKLFYDKYELNIELETGYPNNGYCIDNINIVNRKNYSYLNIIKCYYKFNSNVITILSSIGEEYESVVDYNEIEIKKVFHDILYKNKEIIGSKINDLLDK